MESELKQQFEEMSIEPSENVLGKAVELCVIYNVDDASEFVEQWLAFSVSNLNGDEPTIENLHDFERRVLQTKRDKNALSASKNKTAKYSSSIASLTDLKNAASVPSTPLSMYGVGDEDIMMEQYMHELPETSNNCQTPKTKNVLTRTPARHNDALFSPASYSPIGTPRTRKTTAGSGKIVYTLGNPTIINNAQWSLSTQPKITVRQLLQHNGKTLDIKAKYMHDRLSQKADVAADRIFNISKSLCMKVFGEKTEDYVLSHVDVHTQETVKTIGTIYSDYDGALDSASTLLVGSDIMMCRTVRLNFSKMKSVAVFPGQVVLASGINPRGDVFVVEELFSEQDLMMPSPPRLAEQLSFVVAAGPYTNDDDLVYDPLQDLVTYLKENKPNVLILTGPFVDSSHKLIKENVTRTETFEMFFEKIMDGIIDTVGTDTTILVVASYRDAHADPVYPTMPMTLSRAYSNVHMLPDPSLVDLNGLTIGLTSTDILDHILTQELAVNAGDKVKRAVNYLFHQKSFYPLNPPIEDTINFDSDLASKFANIDQIPNIIILPSDQKCFLRLVNGCLAINPGRLADVNGGTFARFIITPTDPKEETNPFSYIGCQVRKV